jgi:hypothetical protein
MRGKYITTSIMLACLSKPKDWKKEIHIQLKETIAERKKIMRALERLSEKQSDVLIKGGKEAA